MIEQLLEPYQFEFFRNGLAVATIAGALCGLVGVFVVQRGMSYIGHGLSHAIFGGFAASALLGVSYFIGAGVWGVASALAINGVTRGSADRRRRGDRRDHDRVVRARPRAVRALRPLGPELRRRAVREHPRRQHDRRARRRPPSRSSRRGRSSSATARSSSRPSTPRSRRRRASNVARVDALLMVVLAATILATMQVLGVTLVAASVVIPAVVARMLTDSFARMLVLATAIGAACGAVGMNVSYQVDVQSGPTIVLTGAALFAVVLA